ncbi:MAG: DUF998 domain-containing protein [Thermoplasmata archaeon]
MPPRVRWALRASVALVGVYVLLDVAAQLLPPHYSAIAQAESDLAVGPFGYVMTVNFVVRGILSLAFLYGLVGATTLGRRAPVGVALVGVWALGAFVLAASPTDVGPSATLHGMVHLATAAIAFLTASVGAVLLSFRSRDEPRLAAVRVPLLAVAGSTVVALLGLLYVEQRARLAAEAFGLIERVFLGLVLLWILLVALYLLRSGRPVAPGELGS